jgi:hypothetical protein
MMFKQLTATGDTDMVLLAPAVAIFTNMRGTTFRTLHDDRISIHPAIMQRQKANGEEVQFNGKGQ